MHDLNSFHYCNHLCQKNYNSPSSLNFESPRSCNSCMRAGNTYFCVMNKLFLNSVKKKTILKAEDTADSWLFRFLMVISAKCCTGEQRVSGYKNLGLLLLLILHPSWVWIDGMLERHLQTEMAVEYKWYEGIIKLCCVSLQQTTHSHC